MSLSKTLTIARRELGTYFSRAREALTEDGLFVIDVFGGSEAFTESQLEQHLRRRLRLQLGQGETGHVLELFRGDGGRIVVFEAVEKANEVERTPPVREVVNLLQFLHQNLVSVGHLHVRILLHLHRMRPNAA